MTRGVDLERQRQGGGHQNDAAGEKHNRGEGAAISGGALHEGANDDKIMSRPIGRIHGILCNTKLGAVKSVVGFPGSASIPPREARPPGRMRSRASLTSPRLSTARDSSTSQPATPTGFAPTVHAIHRARSSRQENGVRIIRLLSLRPPHRSFTVRVLSAKNRCFLSLAGALNS